MGESGSRTAGDREPLKSDAQRMLERLVTVGERLVTDAGHGNAVVRLTR